jgi:hypothetical protein
MAASASQPPVKRITLALQIAAEFSAGVRGPFIVLGGV